MIKWLWDCYQIIKLYIHDRESCILYQIRVGLFLKFCCLLIIRIRTSDICSSIFWLSKFVLYICRTAYIWSKYMQNVCLNALTSSFSFCSRFGDYQTSFRRCRDFAPALEGLCFIRREFNRFDATVQTYMHNRVHQIFSGSFSDTVTSPNDVLFIVHHTNVDRLFEKWLRLRRRRRSRRNRRIAQRQYWSRLRRPSRRIDLIGHCAQCYAVGFIPVIGNIQLLSNIRRTFGYEYSSYRFGNVP